MVKSLRTLCFLSLALLFVVGHASSAGTEADALWFVQKELGISPDVARVTDASWPSDGSEQVRPDFILIQDVHRNPGVQARIASLILQGYTHWGVKKVFMEGAFVPLDLSLFHRIPKQILPELVKRMVHDGDLSGPEVAAVKIMEKEWSNPPVSPFQLFGIEDPLLYRKNVMAYKSVMQRRGKALYDISSLRQKYQLIDYPAETGGEQGLELLEKLLTLKLTPKEYEVFMLYKDAAPSTVSIDPAVQSALEFYRLARIRSRVFIKQAIQTTPASSAPRILVVGGFHTDDMAAILRRQGRSFIVVSPVVMSARGISIYEQRMQDTVTSITDALATKGR